MEEFSGNELPRRSGNSTRTHRERRDYADTHHEKERDNKKPSSSRHGYSPRSQRPFPRSFQGDLNMLGGYGFDASNAAMQGVPVNGSSSSNPYWDMNAFVPMPFPGADAYMMDSSAFQVPSRPAPRKPMNRGRRETSAVSDYSNGKDKTKQKSKSEIKEVDDEDDSFERLARKSDDDDHFEILVRKPKRRRSDALQSDDDYLKRNGDREWQRHRIGRSEKAGEASFHPRRVDEDRRGKDRSEEERKQREFVGPGGRRKDSHLEPSLTKRRRDSWGDEDEGNTSMDENNRQIQNRSGRGYEDEGTTGRDDNYHRLEKRGPRRVENRRNNGPNRGERVDKSLEDRVWVDRKSRGSWRPADGERRFSRDRDSQKIGHKTGGSPDRVRRVDRERNRSSSRERQQERTRQAMERETQRGREERQRERERDRIAPIWQRKERSERKRSIIPTTPPRDKLAQPARWRRNDSTTSERRISTDRERHDRKDWRDSRERDRSSTSWAQREGVTSPYRTRDPVKEDAKSPNQGTGWSNDDAPPSDAMQAAMEAALGISIKPSISSSIDSAAIEKEQEEEVEEVHQAAPVIRARPDEVYEQVAQVGEGTYGQVFKAKADKTGIIVALKKIRMESEKDGFPITAMREIKILQGLRHENVVRLHEMLLSKNSIYMVFEYLEHDLNGILSQQSIQFTPAHLKSLAKQLLAGLAYLHHHSILHRDLKGSNLLLHRDGTLKIADFGLARRYTKRVKNNADYTNRVVTLWYRPPELLFGETCYNDAIDVWGAGCIFLELFTRKPVFQGNDEIHQVQVLFELLGPIQKRDWPEADTLPWYDLVRPTQDEEQGNDDTTATLRQSRLFQRLASLMPPDALEVAAALLSYNPARRISATGALQMDYFSRNLPRPEKPRAILESVMGEWHEFESRQARRGILSQQNHGSAESVSRLAVDIGQMGPPDATATHDRVSAQRQASA